MTNKIFNRFYEEESLPFMQLRYSNSNKHYKKHFHSCFSLGVNEEGISIYTNKNKKYTLDKNKLSIINPLSVHSCNSCSDLLNKYYMMYIDTSWCYEIQKTIDSSIKEFVPIHTDILNNKEFFKRYISLCKFIFEDFSIEEKQSELISFFMDFFALFLDKKDVQIKNENFEKIVSYLNKNYKENITLEELSKKFELNEFYLIRLFKTNTNLTPHAYILNLKINEAKKLLEEGKTLVDTALSCGFYDQSHFHRNFLKIVASTPKEYQLNFVQ